MEIKLEAIKSNRFRIGLIFFIMSFILLTFIVVKGYTQPLEKELTSTISKESKGILFDTMIYLTYMGGYPFVVPVAISTILLFYRYKEKLLSIFFAGMMISIVPVYKTVKILIQRPRPEIDFFSASGYSYPSGHTTSAFTFFIGLYIFYQVHYNKENDLIFFCLCGALASLVGISRIILGVHFLTDVIGGILLSGILITSFSIGYRKAQKI